MDWQVVAGEAKTFSIQVRYANGGGAARNGDLSVNGTRIAALGFPATGAWTTWQMANMQVPLVAGKNTIRIQGTTADGLANIDYIRVADGGVSPGDCTTGPGPGPDPVDPLATGRAIYGEQCAACHGPMGLGGAVNRPLVKCNLCEESGALEDYIAVAMPPSNPAACDETCAKNVARFILEEFNKDEPTTGAMVTDVRVWRLTIQEYRNTLAQLFKLNANYAWQEGPTDRDSEDSFHTASDFLQTNVTVARYFSEQSEQIVWGLSDAQFTALMNCAPTTATCLRDFTRDFATRAFRRPVSAEDAALYEGIATGAEGLERYRRIAYGIVNSPFFIYRTEMGSEANIAASEVRLTDHEIANLLSYTLLGEPPSAQLLAAAAAGTLRTVESLRTVIDEMLLQPQATARLHRFLRGWLLIDEDNWKDVSRDPDACEAFDDAKDALKGEFQGFLNSNATMADGFSKLLTAYFPEPTGALRDFYESGNDPAGIGPQRQGVLASGMFAAYHARDVRPSPVRRGVFIRERLLCQNFDVPDDVPPLNETPNDPAIVTNRDIYEDHVKNPACSTCHQFFDPLGFTMESLDACGRWRSIDNGQVADTSGEILGTEFNTQVADIDELSTMLADQKQVRECFIGHVFQFYRGLPLSEEPKELIQQIAEGLQEKDQYREILIQLLANEQLLVRKR